MGNVAGGRVRVVRGTGRVGGAYVASTARWQGSISNHATNVAAVPPSRLTWYVTCPVYAVAACRRRPEGSTAESAGGPGSQPGEHMGQASEGAAVLCARAEASKVWTQHCWPLGNVQVGPASVVSKLAGGRQLAAAPAAAAGSTVAAAAPLLAASGLAWDALWIICRA